MVRWSMKCRYVIEEAKIHLLKIKNLIKNRGLIFVIRMLIGIVFGYYYYKLFKNSRTFTFQNRPFNYFYHHYNVTWMSERSVEIPIIWDIVTKNRDKKILELGNVLSHYFHVDHDVVDKYEPSEKIINQDIVEFQPTQRYDLIVSVSTLEHIGWDETMHYIRDPQKIRRAIRQLQRFLTSNGQIVVTFPVGYNHALDEMLKKGEVVFTKRCCMKRVSPDNHWVESNWKDIQNEEYDKPYISANGLVIGFIKGS